MTLTGSKDEGGKSKEQEFVAMKEFSSLSQLNVIKFVKENVRMVKDVLDSSTIKTFRGKVFLSGDAVTEFFSPHLSLNPLVMHASAKIKHMGLSQYEKGKKIAEFKGDKLSVSTNPFLALNPSSGLFDHDGVISKKVKIIEKGRFRRYFASKQYADYLGVEPTGAFGSVDVKKGSKTLKQLYQQQVPFAEIVAFSSFAPNSISGDFSAEIRLGYLITKDKKGNLMKKPFKGGMFTGNVFRLIQNIYLSKEIKEESGYKGPKLIVFNQGIISGLI